VHALGGFEGVVESLSKRRSKTRRRPGRRVVSVCLAVERASCLYWKQVYCLQRSVVTARIARAAGSDAQVVIGYRPEPFLSHAWVEIGGEAVNDCAEYPSRLHVLARI
jgi:prolyl oligopeptidase